MIELRRLLANCPMTTEVGRNGTVPNLSATHLEVMSQKRSAAIGAVLRVTPSTLAWNGLRRSPSRYRHQRVLGEIMDGIMKLVLSLLHASSAPRRGRPMELRELIARALLDSPNGPGNKQCAEHLSRAILAALDAAGLVVVPREPTEEMCRVLHQTMFLEPYDATNLTNLGAGLEAANSYSPFAKKEVG